MSDFDDEDGGGYDYDDGGDGYDYDEAGSELSEDDGTGFEGLLDDEESHASSDERSDDEIDLNEGADSVNERNGFFDMEASEDDGHSEGRSDDESGTSSTMSGDDRESEARRTNRTFHAFPLLPPELREMIWLAASSDLTAKSRVFDFTLVSIAQDGVDELWESVWLEAQTASARAVLATCRESRGIALKRLPDTLPLRGKRFDIRCNLAKDVIFLGMPPLRSRLRSIPDFSDKIKHLALEAEFVSENSHPANFPYMDQDAHDFVLTFSHLETLYSSYTNEDISRGNWSWFKTNELHTYDVHAKEAEYGFQEDMDQIYCWPVGRGLEVVHSIFPKRPRKEDDPDQVTEQNEQPEEDAEEVDDVFDLADSDAAELEREVEEDRQEAIRAVVGRHGAHGFWHLPMAIFQFEEGMYMFKTMMRWKENRGHTCVNPFHCLEGDEDVSEGVSEPDEYESEGIDDDDIPDEDDVGDDEDLDSLVNGDSLASDDYDLDLSPGYGHGPRVEELFDSENDSPVEDNPGEDTDASVHIEGGLDETELPTADFSNPEPESPANSDSEEAESPAQRAKRKPRVVRVVESDSDGDSDDVEVVEVARRTKRRIVSSDSEEDADDGGASTSRPAKRARVIVSDDEDED